MSKGITKGYNNVLVYIRNWNLLKYDCGLLAKCGLEQKNYWYIGSTIEGFSTRTEKFILQMTSNNPSYEKYMNNNTRIFITKLMKFYKEELNKNDEEINKLVFWKHHSEIEVPYKKYVFKKEILKSKYDKCVTFHEMLETKTINQYMYKQLLNSKNEVLNEGDNGVKK